VVQSITVSFKTPVYATAVVVRQTYGNSLVRKILTVDTAGVLREV